MADTSNDLDHNSGVLTLWQPPSLENDTALELFKSTPFCPLSPLSSPSSPSLPPIPPEPEQDLYLNNLSLTRSSPIPYQKFHSFDPSSKPFNISYIKYLTKYEISPQLVTEPLLLTFLRYTTHKSLMLKKLYKMKHYRRIISCLLSLYDFQVYCGENPYPRPRLEIVNQFVNQLYEYSIKTLNSKKDETIMPEPPEIARYDILSFANKTDLLTIESSETKPLAIMPNPSSNGLETNENSSTENNNQLALIHIPKHQTPASLHSSHPLSPSTKVEKVTEVHDPTESPSSSASSFSSPSPSPTPIRYSSRLRSTSRRLNNIPVRSSPRIRSLREKKTQPPVYEDDDEIQLISESLIENYQGPPSTISDKLLATLEAEKNKENEHQNGDTSNSPRTEKTPKTPKRTTRNSLSTELVLTNTHLRRSSRLQDSGLIILGSNPTGFDLRHTKPKTKDSKVSKKTPNTAKRLQTQRSHIKTKAKTNTKNPHSRPVGRPKKEKPTPGYSKIPQDGNIEDLIMQSKTVHENVNKTMVSVALRIKNLCQRINGLLEH